MTQIDTSTEAVEALLKDVTDGPWEIDGIGISHSSKPYGYPIDICLMGEPAQYAGDTPSMLEGWETNARFIAASRELVPALLAERDALKAKLAKAVEAARELMDAFYINGNVTERHYRACQAGVKLETTLAELKGDKDEDS